ncbi:hypothetical protein EC9_54170 [Rosistilla ulvae]|uniref:3-keto-alpha-glucoside-1,2-lyase/3-keto-2-hydroxy-glucal hydratase domain-containing protein n=1 Tax=Rosistilla ulvae TaxID=1930277 RepID=A0A517M8I3_9BACT|nr:DUF1080 domain-containing protein [Rosistilla ulvae]QDS91196.1 hypothetical protein EC9_54170 [Rosistilla ulvae]
MRRLFACFLLLFPIVAVAQSPAPESGFTPLFDGKSLQGWEGDANWFRVDDGAIVAGSASETIPNNFFLATTEQYEDFELRLEAKLVGAGQNAGVQFRTQRIPNHHEVSGYQADMGTAGGKPIWGSLYDESRRNKMLAVPDPAAVEEVLKTDDWNRIRIRCQGARIQIWLNDLQTVDYTETDPQIERTGIIALQIHGGKPAVASYRNIRIQRLK